MAAPETSTRYKPVAPLSVDSSNVLSQDFITTAKILVDSTSSAPVAVFTNPSSGGIAGNSQAEALAIVKIGAGNQICHIARDQATDGGWHARPLFGGRPAEQVVAGVAYPGTSQPTVYGLFVDAGQLFSTALGADGLTWTAPVAMPGEAMSSPRVAYSPSGRLVIYGGNTKGDLVTAYQEQLGCPPQKIECHDFGQSLKGFVA